MNEVLLTGCAATVLSGYLKALGVLRLVAEQADSSVRGAFCDEGFRLSGALDRAALNAFFLTQYAPTPIVTPWNGGSGFYPKDQKAGIDALRATTSERFRPYRETLMACADLLQAAGLQEKPGDEGKVALLLQLRNELPEAALAWLDAAFVVAEEPRYPALLGSGGNDGRLDFANNFMQRLAELFLSSGAGRRRGPEAAAQLVAALYGGGGPGTLQSLAVGQFSPAAAGGVNMGSGVDGGSRVNPWDYVLMLEGTLLCAGAAVRRLEVGAAALGAAAFPFHVRTSSVGYGSAGDADRAGARGELWLPRWHRPASYPELAALFGEGRLELPHARRRAMNGLDATRALASLGVDRGVHAFERFSFLRRNGLAFLATHQGTLRVREEPLAELALLEQAAEHARQLETKERPAIVATALRALNDEIYRVSVGQRQGRAPLGELLVALGRVQWALGQTTKVEGLRPLVLDAGWYQAAHDGRAEFAIAAACAHWWRGARWTRSHPLEHLVELGLRRLREQGVAGLRGPALISFGALTDLLLGRVERGRLEALLFALAAVEALPQTGSVDVTRPLPNPAFALLRAVTSPVLLAEDGRHPGTQTIPLLLRLCGSGQGEAALRLAERRLRASGRRLRFPASALASALPAQPLALMAALLVPLPVPLELDLAYETVLLHGEEKNPERSDHDGHNDAP